MKPTRDSVYVFAMLGIELRALTEHCRQALCSGATSEAFPLIALKHTKTQESLMWLLSVCSLDWTGSFSKAGWIPEFTWFPGFCDLAKIHMWRSL